MTELLVVSDFGTPVFAFFAAGSAPLGGALALPQNLSVGCHGTSISISLPGLPRVLAGEAGAAS